MVIGKVRENCTLAVLRNVAGEVMHGGKKVGMPQMEVGGGNLFDPEVSNREEAADTDGPTGEGHSSA